MFKGMECILIASFAILNGIINLDFRFRRMGSLATVRVL
jgi:hypothetical protein